MDVSVKESKQNSWLCKFTKIKNGTEMVLKFHMDTIGPNVDPFDTIDSIRRLYPTI